MRTPLVRFDHDGPHEVWLKLECLQPIGSFKLRGASSAIRQSPESSWRHGVWTTSAGNMAQGVAWIARELGIPCTVVAPDHAPRAKLDAVERLGARTIPVPFDTWWETMEQGSYPGLDGLFVHPVLDERVMAGNGVIGLELAEELDAIDTVVVPWGAGGLTTGIASALAAVAGGRSVDTTMGFTPLEGLVMATRSGTVDPGALLWLQRHAGLTADAIERALDQEAGLLALSGVSGRMPEVLAEAESGNARARLAIDVYVHRLRAGIAAMAAALGGLDALVFTGGVGEGSHEIRAAAASGVAFLGVVIDESASRRVERDEDGLFSGKRRLAGADLFWEQVQLDHASAPPHGEPDGHHQGRRISLQD